MTSQQTYYHCDSLSFFILPPTALLEISGFPSFSNFSACVYPGGLCHHSLYLLIWWCQRVGQSRRTLFSQIIYCLIFLHYLGTENSSSQTQPLENWIIENVFLMSWSSQICGYDFGSKVDTIWQAVFCSKFCTYKKTLCIYLLMYSINIKKRACKAMFILQNHLLM